jgi:hypothetical protein
MFILKNKMVLIKCRLCEKDVEMPNRAFKFCSKECSNQAQRNRCKQYKKNNPEVIQSYNKKYKEEHKEQTTEYNRNYYNNRRENDENFKIRTDNRVKLSNIVSNYCKTTLDSLKCSDINYRFWIESTFEPDMNFDNYGKLWHIDHVIPVCVFDLKDKIHEDLCFHWKNTRALYKEENRLRKYSFYDILMHELKIKFFLDKHSDKSYDNMNYGVPYLPKQVRDNLLDLINR